MTRTTGLTPAAILLVNSLAAVMGGGVAQPAVAYAPKKGGSKRKSGAARVKAAKKPTPQWLLDRGANSAARKQLAKQMRAEGLDPANRTLWDAAKKEAGIK